MRSYHYLHIALVSLLVGCTPLIGIQKTILLDGPTPLTESDKTIIENRLREHGTALFFDAKFSSANGKTVIKVQGGPEDETTQFLLSHQGLFEIWFENGIQKLTQEDLIAARSTYDTEGQAALNFQLSDKGGKRFGELTAENIGKQVPMRFDGEILTSPVVREAITGGNIQISSPSSLEHAELISTILSNGALSFKPKSVRIMTP